MSKPTVPDDQIINGGKNMGFFKDFKDDFSQAVNELMPGEDNLESTDKDDDMVVNTLEDEVDVASELSKLDGLLEHAMAAAQEEKKMADNTVTPVQVAQTGAQAAAPQEKPIVSDEVSVITEGTIINGDVISNGSLDIRGQVDGNVSCNGKLTVTGVVNGNSNTSEFFADSAQVEGEVVSSGTVKIGLGSVIIGNVTSNSAVIAGAIKGDIDVQGPVVVDTSAVVMGNIKSRSVQINNGAVIEGFCSQCYADVDVQSLFNAKKGN